MSVRALALIGAIPALAGALILFAPAPPALLPLGAFLWVEALLALALARSDRSEALALLARERAAARALAAARAGEAAERAAIEAEHQGESEAIEAEALRLAELRTAALGERAAEALAIARLRADEAAVVHPDLAAARLARDRALDELTAAREAIRMREGGLAERERALAASDEAVARRRGVLAEIRADLAALEAPDGEAVFERELADYQAFLAEDLAADPGWQEACGLRARAEARLSERERERAALDGALDALLARAARTREELMGARDQAAAIGRELTLERERAAVALERARRAGQAAAEAEIETASINDRRTETAAAAGALAFRVAELERRIAARRLELGGQEARG